MAKKIASFGLSRSTLTTRAAGSRTAAPTERPRALGAQPTVVSLLSVGHFGKYAYSDGRWSTGGPTAVPFLLVDVHDSDIATVDYRAADASGGRFFLGCEPRFYFEESDAGEPVDTAGESEGFARWVRDATGAEIDPTDVQLLMAPTGGAPARDDDVVVEHIVGRLLSLAGLPQPDWPTDDDAPAG
jgi:hypothetical protein